MSELRPIEPLHVDEPLEFSDWNDLWNFLDTGGATFNGIEDIEELILSPCVSRLVQRTRFIEAYQYQRSSSNNMGCIVFLVDMFDQREKGERYLAIGPAIPASRDPQSDVASSSPARWLRVSDRGENQTLFIQRQFGSDDLVINHTWDLQKTSIDVPKFANLTCGPLHELHALPLHDQFLMWAACFEAFYSVLGCTKPYDQTNAIRQGTSGEATLRNTQSNDGEFLEGYWEHEKQSQSTMEQIITEVCLSRQTANFGQLIKSRLVLLKLDELSRKTPVTPPLSSAHSFFDSITTPSPLMQSCVVSPNLHAPVKSVQNTNATFDGILFPADSDSPKVTRINISGVADQSGAIDWQPMLTQLLGADADVASLPVSTGIRGEVLRFPLRIFFRANFLTDGSHPNRSIGALVHGKSQREWRGPVVALKYSR
ncbi:hypothetical protein FRC12_007660 [Ceratobasidium sp. 428]|nr:hypothetical protein FRC12_007660 [Ceratobasidium sp. 428]